MTFHQQHKQVNLLLWENTFSFSSVQIQSLVEMMGELALLLCIYETFPSLHTVRSSYMGVWTTEYNTLLFLVIWNPKGPNHRKESLCLYKGFFFLSFSLQICL